MKRIISVLTVMAIMVVMLVAAALPAFAQGGQQLIVGLQVHPTSGLQKIQDQPLTQGESPVRVSVKIALLGIGGVSGR